MNSDGCKFAIGFVKLSRAGPEHRSVFSIVLCHASKEQQGCKGCNPLTGVCGCAPAILAAGEASWEGGWEKRDPIACEGKD